MALMTVKHAGAVICHPSFVHTDSKHHKCDSDAATLQE